MYKYMINKIKFVKKKVSQKKKKKKKNWNISKYLSYRLNILIILNEIKFAL